MAFKGNSISAADSVRSFNIKRGTWTAEDEEKYRASKEQTDFTSESKRRWTELSNAAQQRQDDIRSFKTEMQRRERQNYTQAKREYEITKDEDYKKWYENGGEQRKIDRMSASEVESRLRQLAEEKEQYKKEHPFKNVTNNVASALSKLAGYQNSLDFIGNEVEKSDSKLAKGLYKAARYINPLTGTAAIAGDLEKWAADKIKDATSDDELDRITNETRRLNQVQIDRNIEEKLPTLSQETIDLLDRYNSYEDAEKDNLIARIAGSAASAMGGVSMGGNSDVPFENERRNIENQLMAQGLSIEEIKDLAYLRKSQVEREEKDEHIAEDIKLAEEHPFIAGAKARGENFVGGLSGSFDTLWQLRQNYIDGTDYGIDTQRSAFKYTRGAQAIDQAIQEGHDINVNLFGRDVDLLDLGYNVASSTADNAIRAAASLGNPTGAGIYMATQVFSQSMIDAKDKGYSDGEALVSSAVKAGIEGATEKWSAEQWLKPENAKNWATRLVKSFIAEGSEEVASNILNRIADELIDGDYSDLNQRYEEYISQGMSEEDAIAKVYADMFAEDIESFVVGGLSGGLLGGGSSIVGSFSKNRADTNLGGEIIGQGNAESSVQLARNIAEEYKDNVKNNNKDANTFTKNEIRQLEKLADKAVKSNAKGGNRQSLAYGRLFNLESELTNKQSVSEIENAVASRLTELGEKGDTKQLAKVIVESASDTENISRKNKSAIKNSTYGQRVFNEMTKSDTSNEWAREASFNANMNSLGFSQMLNQKMTVPEYESKYATEEEKQILKNERKKASIAPQVEIGKTHSSATIDTSAPFVALNKYNTQMNIVGGDVADFNDIEFADKNTADLYRIASKMDSVTLANALVKNYGGENVVKYNEEASKIIKAGRLSLQMPTDSFLSESQVKNLYQAGVNVRTGKGGADVKLYSDEEFEKAKKEGGTVKNYKQKLSRHQQYQERALDAIGKKYGTVFVISDIIDNDTANGYYRDGNVIHISLAALNGNYLAVAGHELFHYLEKNNEALANQLRDFVIDRLQKSDKYDFEAEFNRKARLYKTTDKNAIYSEMVAESMFDVFDEESVKTLVKENSNLAQQIMDFINEFLDFIASLADELTTAEARALRDDTEALKEIRKMFYEGLEGVKNTTTESGGVENMLAKKDYSYEYLISKPDMKVTIFDSSDYDKKDVNISRENVRKKGIENAKNVGFVNDEGEVFVKVNDINKNIKVTKDSLKHSFDRRYNALAPVIEHIGEILENAVKINELNARDDYSKVNDYVLIGYAQNIKGEPYIVTFVVNTHTYELSSFDVLYSVNAKKESAGRSSPRIPKGIAVTDSNISISDLLDFVNKYFSDILPEDVLKHYGYNARPKGKLGKSALYSLKDVAPVNPSSDLWKRTSTTSEAMGIFPNLWNISADESEVRNPTQIKSTVSTYRKIYDYLKGNGFDGTILDASSGLGYGTKAGIEEYGFDVEDIEPYPDKSYKPKYTDYSKLNKKYDAIISNAVLNVLPQDQRDALVVKMGEMLNDGGQMFINTRSKDVDTLAKTKGNINLSPMEWIVANTGSYQKGFTKNELKAYLEDALGDGFKVETTNMFGAASVIVTKVGTASAQKDAQITVASDGALQIDPESDIIYSLKYQNLGDAKEDEIAQAVYEATGYPKEKTLQFIKDMDVMAVSLKDTYIDFVGNPKETAIKNNTDYPQGTIDLTNICTKRLPITNMTSRLQNEMPTELFTADDYADIRLLLMNDGSTVACGLCFVEDRRKLLGEITKDFMDRWNQALKNKTSLQKGNDKGDVVIGEDLAKRYGVKPGKVVPFKVKMDQATFSVPKNWFKLQEENPLLAASYEAFNNARGQSAGRLLLDRAEYKREILNWSKATVEKTNNAGGLRIFSFSDFETIHLFDLIQIIQDCATMGVKIQGYTKQPDFAKLVSKTGIKLNRSFIPYGATGIKTVNGKKVLAIDTKEGIDTTSKDFLNEKGNANVGNNITGINDEQIHLAFEDDYFHYIIPFHTGKSQEANTKLGVGKWENYKNYQEDKAYDDIEQVRKVALLTKKYKQGGYNEKHMRDTDAFDRAKKEVLGSAKAKFSKDSRGVNIYTDVLNENIKTERQFTERYLEVCREKKIVPRFAQFLDCDANGDFVYTPGYYKLLVDFKLFDENGKYLPQGLVTPDFDSKFIKEIIDRDMAKSEGERSGATYSDKLYNDVKTFIEVKHTPEKQRAKHFSKEQIATYNRMLDIVNETQTKSNLDNGLDSVDVSPSARKMSLKDTEYLNAVENGNEAEAQKLIDEAAQKWGALTNDNGNLIKLYHGTRSFGFTEFDLNKMDDKRSIFLTSDLQTAKSYSSGKGVRYTNKKRNDAVKSKLQNSYDKAMQDMVTFLVDKFGDDFDFKAEFETLSNSSNKYRLKERDEFLTNYFDGLLEEYYEENYSDYDVYGYGNKEYEDYYEFSSSKEAEKLEEEYYKYADPLMEYATEIAEDESGESGVYSLYVKLSNPLVVDAEGSSWNNINYNGKKTYTRELVSNAYNDGYDGVVIKNLRDVADTSYLGAGTSDYIVVAFDSSQVKSADAVTYDNEGEVIPLSERFSEDKDIRYSLKDSDYTINDSKAVMTQKRLDFEIEYSGAGSRTDYAQGWITSISPSDFLNLTSQPIVLDRDSFDENATGDRGGLMKDYDYDKAIKESRYAPYLHVDIDTGRVISYDGRHRMRSLEKQGITSAEIVISFYKDWQMVKYATDSQVALDTRVETKPEVTLTSKYETEYGEEGKEVPSAVVYNVIPLNEDHRAEIEANYGEKASPEAAIRYSLKDVNAYHDALVDENEKLKETIETLKAEFKLSEKHTMNKNQVDVFAGKLLRKAGSKFNKATLVEDLTRVFEYIANDPDANYDTAISVMKDIAMSVIDESYNVDTTLYDEYKGMRDLIRTTRVYIPEDIRTDIGYGYGGYEKFRRSMFGKMRLVNDPSAMSIDEFYNSMTDEYAEFFPEAYTESEEINNILSALDATEKTYVSPYEGAYADEAAYLFAIDMFNAYFDIAEKHTFADKQKAKLVRARAESRRKLEEYKQYAKEREDKALKELRTSKNEQIKKIRANRDAKIERIIANNYIARQNERERRKEQSRKEAARRQIIRTTKRINNLLVNPTDQKHIPESLKSSVLEFCEMMSETGIFDSDRLTRLSDAYEAIANSIEGKNADENSQEYADARNLYSMYDEDVSDILLHAKEALKGRRLSQLSLSELGQLKMAVDNLNFMIKNENKMFGQEKKETYTEYGEKLLTEFGEKGQKGELHILNKVKWARRLKTGMDALVNTGNMKPVYFFEKVGGTMESFYEDIAKGEDDWARIMDKTRAFILNISEKYHFDEWRDSAHNDEKTIKFKTEQGKTIELTTEEALSVYASFKREQGREHIMKGGITLEDNFVTKGKGLFKRDYKESAPTRLSLNDMMTLSSKLTDEQKAFADEMVKYLSSDMAALGNKVSMELFGIKKYLEDYYFPISSDRNYIYSRQVATQDDSRIKHKSLTKRTVVNANNPISIGKFSEVWARHCDDMAIYSSFAVPLENFNRVYNYKNDVLSGEGELSVKQAFGQAFGKNYVDYVNTLMLDINGGVNVNGGTTIADNLVSLFKKGAVMASMSVVIQQPSAIARALALVDAKYFAKTTFGSRSGKTYEEIKKYAPVAIIKEMGYFDTGMGHSTVDWLTAREYDGLAEKAKAFFKDRNVRDDAFGYLAGKADEITWCHIWNACKAEVRDKTGYSGEVLLQKTGERFTEVIHKTQVYDSVFSRSQNMRSKNALYKMATSFMAEPTTSLNMLLDAIDKARHGDKKYFVKAITALVSSYVLNALLVSLVYSARDKDDEPFEEKYLKNFITNFLQNINPLNMIPFVKDAWSIFRGYDVERADMSIISDLSNNINATAKAIENGDKSKITDSIVGFAGSLSAFTGIPLKNAWRDIKAVGTLAESLGSEKQMTGEGLWNDILDEYSRGTFKIFLKGKKEDEQMYEALLKGDKESADKHSYNLLADGKTIGQIHSAMVKYLKENEDIIRAAEARNKGRQSEYMSVLNEYKAKGFAQDDIVKAVNGVINSFGKEDKAEETETDTDETISIWKTSDIIITLESGENADNIIKSVYDEKVEKAIAKGKSEAEAKKSARSSIKKSLTSHFKPLYLSGDSSVRQIVLGIKVDGEYLYTADDINKWK